MKSNKRNMGFTLAELLIVVAILGVLISVAVPLFGAQRERANIAVDQATMRNAYAHFVAESLTGDVKTDTLYYYDAASQSFVTTRPANGYGKSKTDAGNWWTGVGTASGTPNSSGKHPAALALRVDDAGSVEFRWGGGAYTGLNVTGAEDYQTLANGAKFTEVHTKNGKQITCEYVEEFVQRDKVLIDSLQNEMRSMSFAEFQSLFLNSDGTLKAGLKSQKMGSYVCVHLSDSRIERSTGKPDQKYKDSIYFPELFEAAGYDTTGEKYVINSVDDNVQTLWVNLRMTENELKTLDEAAWKENQKKIYTYVKSGGAETPLALQEAERKKQ